MTIFKMNDQYEIVCNWINTRYGFKHEAHLMSNGNEIEKAKVCYYNRTWELYQYQTVMANLIEKSKYLSGEQKEEFKNKIYHRS
jgi:hypothetical protein